MAGEDMKPQGYRGINAVFYAENADKGLKYLDVPLTRVTLNTSLKQMADAVISLQSGEYEKPVHVLEEGM